MCELDAHALRKVRSGIVAYIIVDQDQHMNLNRLLKHKGVEDLKISCPRGIK